MKLVIHGNPVTKKNSQRPVFVGHRCQACGKGQRLIVLPSKSYETYEKAAIRQLKAQRAIRLTDDDGQLEVSCVYYMRTLRQVDLTNLLEATDDVLVAAGIIPDDNFRVIGSHDGSRVRHDSEDPRVEITIRRME